MKISLSTMAIAGLVGFAGVSEAGVIVDTLPADDRAGIADYGQTFTANGLGGETNVLTIEIEGPRDNQLADFVSVEIYVDTDGDQSTWDPGAMLGVSTNTAQLLDLTVSTFNLAGVELAEGDVYGLKISNGSLGFAPRVGLKKFSALGNTDGTVFSAGATVFGDNYDTAMRITTGAVPEPASFALLAIGGLALIRRK